MKKQLLILALTTLIAASCYKSSTIQDSSSLNRSLNSVEKILYSNPTKALESIDSLTQHYTEQLAVTNTNYHLSIVAHLKLLEAIAHEQRGGTLSYNSYLTSAIEIYRESGDLYNLTRALLYRTIPTLQGRAPDSTNRLSLLEAQHLYAKGYFEDDNLGAKLYLYLAKAARREGDYNGAKKELERSLYHSKRANNSNCEQSVYLELFHIALQGKKYGEALTAISNLANYDKLPFFIEERYFMAMYSFYNAKKEYRLAIEYLRKIVEMSERGSPYGEIDTPKAYQLMSLQYRRLGELDKELHYLELAANEAEKREHEKGANSHFYLRSLASNYQNSGRHQEAATLYKKAYYSYMRVHSQQVYQKAIELEAQFNSDKLRLINERAKMEERKLRRLLIALSITLILLTLFISYRLHKVAEKNRTLQKKATDQMREERRNWLISQIFIKTSSSYANMSDIVSTEIGKIRRESPEAFSEITSTLDSSAVAIRGAFGEIVKGRQFKEYYREYPELEKLTDFEKMVYLLGREEYNNHEIAHLLNSSSSSIRTIRSRLQKKIENNSSQPQQS